MQAGREERRRDACATGEGWAVGYDSGVGKTVVLLHELPDGTSHYDWMIDAGGEGLMTFRLRELPRWGETAEFEAQRIADHRREYLAYEGPVPGRRGTVRREAEGTVEAREDSPGRMTVRVRMGDDETSYRGEELQPGKWRWIRG